MILRSFQANWTKGIHNYTSEVRVKKISDVQSNEKVTILSKSLEGNISFYLTSYKFNCVLYILYIRVLFIQLSLFSSTEDKVFKQIHFIFLGYFSFSLLQVSHGVWIHLYNRFPCHLSKVGNNESFKRYLHYIPHLYVIFHNLLNS